MSSYKPSARPVKTHLFPRQPDAAQALGLEERLLQIPQAQRQDRKGKKIQIADKSNFIKLFSLSFSHTVTQQGRCEALIKTDEVKWINRSIGYLFVAQEERLIPLDKC